MKKTFLLSVGLLFALLVNAQVVLTLQLPPLGLTIRPQLWNLSMINTTDENLNLRIEMEMTDVSNGLLVLKGSSRMLVLPRGVKQVQVGDVVPITYTMGNPGYPVDANPDGFLPIGAFNICYSIIKLNSDAPEVLTEECVTLEVEPLSPPQLIIPLDSEHVAFTRPFFAWMPPAPFNSFSSMYFDWLLVEVQPTQSAADAIQQNVPVYTQQNVQFTAFQYPLNMPELDSSKLYAWRITAKNNISPVANSEIWTFRVRKYEDQPEPVMPPGYFARVHREENAAFTICNGILRFEFQQDQNSPSATINIFDISSNTRKKLALDSTDYSMQYGQNFVQIDLRETSGMVNDHMYLLEMITPKNERWYLRFQYRRPNEQ